MKIRRSDERGRANFGWLDSRHTFSFGQYYDAAWMQHGKLRVLNDDTVLGGGGFDPHPHQDMEIVSYVTRGALAHQDSMGHESVVPAGRLQRMTAGRGVVHSEYNASRTEPVHFFQIWIPPRTRGLEPEYDERDLAETPEREGWKLAFSPDARDGAMVLHQDAWLYIGQPKAGDALDLSVPEGARLWAHVSRGLVQLQGQTLAAGDAAGLEAAGAYRFHAAQDAEILAFVV